MPRCKVCSTQFKPRVSSFQKTCEKPECLAEYWSKIVKKQQAKRGKEIIAELKEKHKDGPYYKKILQATFNTYIRLRDAKLPCISCGTTNDIQYHAGHYLSVGAFPNLRFNEDNNHKQCVRCNDHLSGNLTMYRKGLIAKIGIERFDALEAQKGVAKNYTVEELKELIQVYKQKIKELKK